MYRHVQSIFLLMWCKKATRPQDLLDPLTSTTPSPLSIQDNQPYQSVTLNTAHTCTCIPTFPAQLLGCLDWRTANVRIQFTDHGVCRMTDQCTEHTGNVAPGECHNQLSRFAHLVTWVWHNVLVQKFNSSFKSGEFHHGIGDLSEPEWRQTLVEPERKRESVCEIHVDL